MTSISTSSCPHFSIVSMIIVSSRSSMKASFVAEWLCAAARCSRKGAVEAEYICSPLPINIISSMFNHLLGGLLLFELVARAGAIVHTIDIFQLRDTTEGFFIERRNVLEGVQDDAFEQISQGNIVVFSKRFQHFEHALLHPHADLYALDLHYGVFFRLRHVNLFLASFLC